MGARKKYKALVRIGLLIPLGVSSPDQEYLFNFLFRPREIPAIQRELAQLVEQWRNEAPLRRKRAKILQNTVNITRKQLEREGVVFKS